MLKYLMAPALAGMIWLAPSAVTAVQGEPAQADATPCFQLRDWGDWKASPDRRAVYVRVANHWIYRLDLSSACPSLRAPDARLITRGTIASICAPIDVNLTVSNPTGGSEQCIVRGLTRLTADEANALPKSLRP